MLNLIFAVFIAASCVSIEPAVAQQDDHTTNDDLARLQHVLKDPSARAKLIADIDALNAAEPTRSAAVSRPSQPSEWSPEFIRYLSGSLARLTSFRGTFANTRTYIETIYTNLRSSLADPDRRDALMVGVLRIIAVILASLITIVVAERVAARLKQAFQPARQPPLPQRVLYRTARSLTEALVPGALIALGYLAVLFAQPAEPVRLSLIVVLVAVVAIQGATLVGRFLVSPFTPQLRLIRCQDDTAAYAYIWLKRLSTAAAMVFAVNQIGLILSLPLLIQELASRLGGLIVAILAVVCVLQNRKGISTWIAGRENASTTFRGRIASIWHIVAIIYILAVFVVWAAHVPNGFAFMVRGSLLTALILPVAQIALGLVNRALSWILAINKELLTRYPLLEQRADLYTPFLRKGAAVAVRIVAALAILSAWQIDVAAELASPTGILIVTRLATVLGALILALVAWEFANGLIIYQLERRDASGRAVVSSARLRTLLPLVRNVVLIVIGIMTTLTVLSQVGLDITPLLAGAGVVGLAIGFGSQTLVKDVITGAFILAEDTVNIGDVATINGIGGLVEGMSVRTIRLRDLEGVVHTIPFGSINAISNMTKDYSYYLLDVGVAYKENTDKVVETLRKVFATLAQDEKYARDIVGDFEVLGVDRFEDSAVYVRARIKTRPIRQWDIGREFNRRMKMTFDELGIEIPFPQRTIHLIGGAAAEPSAKADDEALSRPSLARN